MSKLTAYAMVAALWVPYPARAQDPPAAAVPLDVRLDRAILRHGLGQFWGAVLVAKDGTVALSKGYGLANDTLAPIDDTTLFEIASTSKPFTAITVLALEAEGRLSIDDPIAKHFPASASAAAGITIRHLLNHTSGMSDGAGALQEYGFADRDAAVRLALAAPRKTQPGSAYDYCNAGYVVLAALIESTSRQRFEDAVRQRVFTPAGMGRSGFIDGEGLDLSRQTARRAPGSTAGRAMACGFPWGWGYRGAGGVVTSLEDLRKWDRALAGESLLATQAKKRMYEVGKGRYACGWNVELTPRGTTKAHHSGGVAGFRCQVARHLEDGCFVAILTNEAWDPFAIEALIEAELFAGEPEEVAITIDPRALELSQYKTAEFRATSGWRVAREPKSAPGGGRVVVTLAGPVGGKACVTLAFTPAALVAFRVAVADVVEDRTAAADGAAMDVMVCVGPYSQADGGVVLPRGVKVRMAAFYRGDTVDARPTLSLDDASGGSMPGGSFSPVIVRMDPGQAAALLRELERIGD